MQHKFNLSNCKTIFNGYSDELWSKVKPRTTRNDKIIISYIGSIDFNRGSFRDTAEFFKAYEMLRCKNLFEIRFIGTIETDRVKELIKEFPEIIFKPKVSVIKSLELMRDSNYLLNIHTSKDESSKYLMGAKILDYLRSGKTIISINDSDSFEHKFLKGKNAILCVNDYREILKVLEGISQKNISSTTYDSTKMLEVKEIQMYSREFQNEKFVKIIKNL